MSSHEKVCRNCGNHLAGTFCSECGQKQFSEHDKTFGHFVHDVVHEATHVDSKVFGTFWTLLTKPGVLTEDYWAGRLGKWIRPLRLFVVISTIHFLLVGGVGPLNMSSHTSRSADGTVKFAFKPGKSVISSTEKPEDKEFREKVDQKAHKVYTWLRYSSLLALATVSFLLFRKRQPYFVDHLVSAMHLYSFQLLISVGLAPLIFFCKSYLHTYTDLYPYLPLDSSIAVVPGKQTYLVPQVRLPFPRLWSCGEYPGSLVIWNHCDTFGDCSLTECMAILLI